MKGRGGKKITKKVFLPENDTERKKTSKILSTTAAAAAVFRWEWRAHGRQKEEKEMNCLEPSDILEIYGVSRGFPTPSIGRAGEWVCVWVGGGQEENFRKIPTFLALCFSILR